MHIDGLLSANKVYQALCYCSRNTLRLLPAQRHTNINGKLLNRLPAFYSMLIQFKYLYA